MEFYGFIKNDIISKKKALLSELIFVRSLVIDEIIRSADFAGHGCLPGSFDIFLALCRVMYRDISVKYC